MALAIVGAFGQSSCNVAVTPFPTRSFSIRRQPRAAWSEAMTTRD